MGSILAGYIEKIDPANHKSLAVFLIGASGIAWALYLGFKFRMYKAVSMTVLVEYDID